MKNKRWLALAMGTLMAVSVTACGSSQAVETKAGSEAKTQNTQNVKLTFMNSKPELDDAFAELFAEYKELTGVDIEMYTSTKAGETIGQKYAAGDPATIMMCEYTNIQDIGGEKILDLSDEKWVADGGETYGGKKDGKVYGFPFCIEAKGVLYNKTAIENITEEEFNPDDYKTLDEFTELLEKLKAGGMETPVILNAEDWSLGSHFIQGVFQMQNVEAAKTLEFFDEIKAGTAGFENNGAYNAMLDMLDVMKEYNINKADPLAADYDLNASYFAEGKAAFWLNGSWAWPDAEEFMDGSMEYGEMPYPINGDFDTIGNLCATATKYLAIDGVKATPEEQQAAKDFLNWLVYDEKGQDTLVNKFQILPAFTNITLEMTNDFNASVKTYLDNGRTNELVPYPSGLTTTMGGHMQKYLVGEESRDVVAEALDNFIAGR